MNLMKEDNMENPVAEEINTPVDVQLPKENKVKNFFVKLGKTINDIPLWQKILILAACCTLDYFTCVVLLIGTLIFMSTGNKGLAITLALCNMISPDNLPVIDEAFGVLAVLIPIIIEYNKTGSVKLAADAGLKSKKDYKKTKKNAKGAFASLIKEKTEENNIIEDKNLDE